MKRKLCSGYLGAPGANQATFLRAYEFVTNGKLTTFRVPKSSYIWDITTGPDGKLYFIDGASRVWSVTTS
jgi:hypothetical protein